MPDICAPSLQEESLPAESALTTETQERASLPDLLVEDIKKGINNSLKEIQEDCSTGVPCPLSLWTPARTHTGSPTGS